MIPNCKCLCMCVCMYTCIICICLVIQSCLTLCDPLDCSLLGSSVHGDSPGKNTGVGCHALLTYTYTHTHTHTHTHIYIVKILLYVDKNFTSSRFNLIILLKKM